MHEELSKKIPEPQGIGGISSKVEDESFKKILREVRLLTAKDKGKLGAIFEKLETLKTDREKAAIAESIRERLGPRAFRDLKKRAFLLDLINKVKP